MKIAYLGPSNTYTEKAAKELFSSDELIPLQPILKVIKAVENSEAEYGVVPLENFYEGEVRETLDALTSSKTSYIIKDKAIDIIHCLGVHPKNKSMDKILSKDQALGQCSEFIYKNYPNAITIATSSTSEAAIRITKENLLDSAAISSEESLKKSGLKIIAKDLCKNNKTRFVVIGKKENPPTGHDKTFLVFHPIEKDRPGTLQGNLSFFSNLGINLEYIQSRPDGKGGYFFYVELDGHVDDKAVHIALKALKYSLDPRDKYPDTIKILGSYPNIDWKNH